MIRLLFEIFGGISIFFIGMFIYKKLFVKKTIPPKIDIGLIDDQKDHRYGLICAAQGTFVKPENYSSLILEIEEIYQDSQMSKIKIVRIAKNKTAMSSNDITNDYNYNWYSSKLIYWLSPPLDVTRNDKLEEILNK